MALSVKAGNFTLPKDKAEKLVFIAGGIGITPYRSMIKFLIDTNSHRDIVLFYAVSTPSDFVYKELFDKAGKTIGLKTEYVVGRIDEEIIKKAPDYKNRKFYLSGPQGMVNAYKILLNQLHQLASTVKSDRSELPYLPLTELFHRDQPREDLFDQIPHGCLVEIVRPNWNLRDKIGTNANRSDSYRLVPTIVIEIPGSTKRGAIQTMQKYGMP